MIARPRAAQHARSREGADPVNLSQRLIEVDDQVVRAMMPILRPPPPSVSGVPIPRLAGRTARGFKSGRRESPSERKTKSPAPFRTGGPNLACRKPTLARPRRMLSSRHAGSDKPGPARPESATGYRRLQAPSAWSRSAIRSSGFSIPTDSRISAGVMPSRICSSGGMSEWVIEAGCEASALRPAEADRELEHLEPVERGEGLRLAALDLEGEGRAGAPALAFEQRPVGMIRRAGSPRYQTEATRGWLLRKPATLRAPSADAVIRSFRVSSERIRSQPVCGSHIVPRIVRMPRIGLERGARPRAAAGDQVGVAADIFGQRGHDEVGAVGDRRLEQRSEKGVVDDRPPGAARRARSGRRPVRGRGRCRRGRWSDWPASRDRAPRPARARAPASTACSIAFVPPSAENSIGVTPNCGRILFRRKSVPP